MNATVLRWWLLNCVFPLLAACALYVISSHEFYCGTDLIIPHSQGQAPRCGSHRPLIGQRVPLLSSHWLTEPGNFKVRARLFSWVSWAQRVWSVEGSPHLMTSKQQSQEREQDPSPGLVTIGSRHDNCTSAPVTYYLLSSEMWTQGGDQMQSSCQSDTATARCKLEGGWIISRQFYQNRIVYNHPLCALDTETRNILLCFPWKPSVAAGNFTTESRS